MANENEKIFQMKDHKKNGEDENLYPITKTNAIYDEHGNLLSDIVNIDTNQTKLKKIFIIELEPNPDDEGGTGILKNCTYNDIVSKSSSFDTLLQEFEYAFFVSINNMTFPVCEMIINNEEKNVLYITCAIVTTIHRIDYANLSLYEDNTWEMSAENKIEYRMIMDSNPNSGILSFSNNPNTNMMEFNVKPYTDFQSDWNIVENDDIGFIKNKPFYDEHNFNDNNNYYFFAGTITILPDVDPESQYQEFAHCGYLINKIKFILIANTTIISGYRYERLSDGTVAISLNETLTDGSSLKGTIYQDPNTFSLYIKKDQLLQFVGKWLTIVGTRYLPLKRIDSKFLTLDNEIKEDSDNPVTNRALYNKFSDIDNRLNTYKVVNLSKIHNVDGDMYGEANYDVATRKAIVVLNGGSPDENIIFFDDISKNGLIDFYLDSVTEKNFAFTLSVKPFGLFNIISDPYAYKMTVSSTEDVGWFIWKNSTNGRYVIEKGKKDEYTPITTFNALNLKPFSELSEMSQDNGYENGIVRLTTNDIGTNILINFNTDIPYSFVYTEKSSTLGIYASDTNGNRLCINTYIVQGTIIAVRKQTNKNSTIFYMNGVDVLEIKWNDDTTYSTQNYYPLARKTDIDTVMKPSYRIFYYNYTSKKCTFNIDEYPVSGDVVRYYYATPGNDTANGKQCDIIFKVGEDETDIVTFKGYEDPVFTVYKTDTTLQIIGFTNIYTKNLATTGSKTVISRRATEEYVHITITNEVLTKSNTDIYTPTEDYHPATKEYVDSHASITYVAGELDATTAKPGLYYITPVPDSNGDNTAKVIGYEPFCLAESPVFSDIITSSVELFVRILRNGGYLTIIEYGETLTSHFLYEEEGRWIYHKIFSLDTSYADFINDTVDRVQNTVRLLSPRERQRLYIHYESASYINAAVINICLSRIWGTAVTSFEIECDLFIKSPRACKFNIGYSTLAKSREAQYDNPSTGLLEVPVSVTGGKTTVRVKKNVEPVITDGDRLIITFTLSDIYQFDNCNFDIENIKIKVNDEFLNIDKETFESIEYGNSGAAYLDYTFFDSDIVTKNHLENRLNESVPDWDQSDDSANDYIKNKPFYDTYDLKFEYGLLEVNQGNQGLTPNPQLSIGDGDKNDDIHIHFAGSDIVVYKTNYPPFPYTDILGYNCYIKYNDLIIYDGKITEEILWNYDDDSINNSTPTHPVGSCYAIKGKYVLVINVEYTDKNSQVLSPGIYVYNSDYHDPADDIIDTTSLLGGDNFYVKISKGEFKQIDQKFVAEPCVYMSPLDTDVYLEPNKLYIFPEMETLTYNLIPPSRNGIAAHYHFIFDSPETPTEVVHPLGVRTTSFVVGPNKTYEVSIMEGLLISQSFYGDVSVGGGILG